MALALLGLALTHRSSPARQRQASTDARTGGFNRCAQGARRVVLMVSCIRVSYGGGCSGFGRSGGGLRRCARTGRFLWACTGVAGHWCSHSIRAARVCCQGLCGSQK
jgi:hypothetical protein